MSESLAAFVAFIAGAAACMMDGRRAAALTAVAAAIGTAPAVALVAGGPAAVVVLGVAGLTAVMQMGGEWGGQRFPHVDGLDPLVPVAEREGLFGPRSVRAAGAAVALPAASWVGLNVAIGGVATATGALFAVSYIFLVGGLRFLQARTVEDITCGLAAVSVAAAAAWLLQVGPTGMPEAGAIELLAPAAGLLAGWLSGRHGHASVHGVRA